MLQVRLRVAEGRRDELIAAAHRVADATRREPGCLSYRFYEDTEEPGTFAFVEEYRDMAALEAHRGASYYNEYRAAATGLVAGREAKLYEIASAQAV